MYIKHRKLAEYGQESLLFRVFQMAVVVISQLPGNLKNPITGNFLECQKSGALLFEFFDKYRALILLIVPEIILDIERRNGIDSGVIRDLRLYVKTNLSDGVSGSQYQSQQ